MKFRKMVSGLLACALVVTSVLTGNVSTVKAEGTAVTNDAAEGNTALKAGDYYIMNTKTGRFLNGANSWGTQGSALTYGQLMTVGIEGESVSPQDGGTYSINTYISNNNNRNYVGDVDNGNVFLDSPKATLTITSCGNGSYTIQAPGKQYLSASSEAATKENTIVTYNTDKSDLSEWRFLTREEFIEYAKETVAKNQPADVTSLIFDSNFSRSNTYGSKWKGTAFTKTGKNHDGTGEECKENYCVETFNAEGESYQTLEGIPNGVYEISLQGFYNVNPGETSTPAKYFGNDVEKDLMTVQEGGKTEQIANSWTDKDGDIYRPSLRGDAARCFTAGGYVNDPITVEVIDHTLKLGVKLGKGNWVVWDNFNLKLKRLITDDELAARPVVRPVIKLISQIGEVALTPASKRKIDAARTAYDALTEAEKGFVTNAQVLTDAEAAFKALIEAEGGQATFDGLAADEVAVKIGAIGTVDLTDASKEKIDAARKAYDVLTNAQKALLEEEFVTLTNAEARYQELVPEQAALAAGDYYMINNKTGGLFNGGNAWGTQGSALDHGQLVTLSLVGKDTYHYYINTHIQEEEGKSFLDGEPYTDRDATPMVIVKTANGSYTIASPEGKYLTANDADTTLSCGRKTEYSEWSILTREEYIEYVLETFDAEHPTDVSTLIFDPKFSRCNTYLSKWDQTPAKGGDNENNCVEKYNTTFNTSQIIKDIPNGTYQLTVQGFYRMDSEPTVKPKYYANGEKKELMAAAAGGKAQKDEEHGFTTEFQGKYIPWWPAECSKSFNTGAYTNEPITVTVTDHTLKIGVEAEEKVGGNTWIVWDNFTLKLVSVEDSEYSDRVAAKIDAIGEVVLTDECKAKIDAARTAYDKLTDSQKALITDKGTVLTNAEKKYADLKAAAAATEKIDAIGTYTFTTACKARIDAAREAYDALTDDQKALVDEAKKTALETAESSYNKDFQEKGDTGLNQADAAAAVALINAIGDVVLTDECKEKIDVAREAYDALSTEAKKIVTAEQLKVLTDAEKEYKDLENAADLAVIADKLTPKINAIVTPVTFTSDSRLQIKAARDAYEALTPNQKELVEQASYSKLTDAEQAYAAAVTAGSPVQAAGDYYIVNVLTGKYLNADAQIKASQSDYGQLMTVAVDAEDKTSYTVDTHYKEGTNHYLDAEGFLIGEETDLKIEKSKDGNINIANAEDQFLTASAKGAAVTFVDQRTEGSEWKLLTREQLIEKLSVGITEEKSADVTSLISDPGFDKNNEYFENYTYSDTLTKLVKDGDNSNMECYREAFDFSQTIENIPNGVYEFTLQGFYRADEGSAGAASYYINGTEQAFKTIESEGKEEEDKEGGWSVKRGDVYVPNTMTDAAKCFAEGAYVNEPVTVTVTNHTLKIGVKSDANNWVIWDSFHLELKEVVSDQKIADDVVAKIDAIGTPITFTKECWDKIDAARKAYDALGDDQKKLVASAKVEALEAAEAEYERLRQEQIPSEELKASLKDTIAQADAEPLETAAYTADSLQAYKDALAELKKLARNKDATKDEIEAALAAFKEADEGLVVNEEYKPTDKQKQDLAAGVENAAKLKAESYKQDENWTAFQEVLAKAQKISNRANATKNQVDKAMKDLEAAIAKLTPAQEAVKANKTKLNSAIKAASGLKEKTYTPATWKAFKTALDTAKSISAKQNATQKEVDNAWTALTAKQKALKKAATGFTITDKATGSKPAKIAAGKSVTLKAQAKPTGASSSVKWSIDNTSKKKKYATISSKGVLKVSKKAAGKKITVTATSTDGRGAKGTVKITVMKNAVTKVTLKAAKKSVKAGKSVTVKATVKVNGKKVNKALTWKSSNTKYATVNSKGKVTTKKAGKGKTVTITAFATDGSGKKGTVKIKITK